MKFITCPGCGHRVSLDQSGPVATLDKIKRVRAAAAELGLTELPGGYYHEGDAASLVGLTASALRKQVQEGRCRMGYVARGKRRFYPVEELALNF